MALVALRRGCWGREGERGRAERGDRGVKEGERKGERERERDGVVEREGRHVEGVVRGGA